MRKYGIGTMYVDKEDNEKDPSRAFIEMPLGARILDCELIDGNRIAVAVLVEQPPRPRVKHRLLIIPMDQLVTVDLGRTVGEKLGFFQAQYPGGRVTTVFVFQDLPWPTSVLEGVEPAGKA